MRLFIKKFLLHPARQKHTSRRRLGRPLEKPVCSAATITTTTTITTITTITIGRFLSRDIALQYYIILRRYVEFRLVGFNERLAGGSRLADLVSSVPPLRAVSRAQPAPAEYAKSSRAARRVCLGQHTHTLARRYAVTHRSVQPRQRVSTTRLLFLRRAALKFRFLNSDYIRDNVGRSYIYRRMETHQPLPLRRYPTLRCIGFFTTSSPFGAS